MKCYHCDYENNEDAIFCKICGQRVDGKVECNHCKRLIDYDSQFCEFCGAQIQCEDNIVDGKEESYGYSTSQIIQNKTGGICCKVFSLAATFFSLFFTFFIGIVFTGIDKIYTQDTLAPYSYNLYSFVELCKKITELNKLNLTDFTKSNLYFVAVCYAIVSILIILAMVSLAITMIVKYVNNIKNKSNKSYFPYAIATYSTYIASVALFCALYGSSGHTNETAISFDPNIYTIIGIMLSTVCIVIAIISKTIESYSNQLAAQRSTAKISFSLLSVLMLGVVVTLASLPAASMSTTGGTASYNYINAMSTIATIFETKEPVLSPVTGLYYSPDAPIALYTHFVFAFILQIAIIVISAILLYKHIHSMSNKEQTRSGLVIAIAFFVINIVYTVLSITAQNSLLEYAEVSSDTASANILLPIMLAIFSLIYLIISICNAVVNNRIQRNEQK